MKATENQWLLFWFHFLVFTNCSFSIVKRFESNQVDFSATHFVLWSALILTGMVYKVKNTIFQAVIIRYVYLSVVCNFMKRPDDFKPDTVRQVAERAGYICSNPKCRRITIGPDNSNQVKSTKTGIAAHICAASPGGPRYDMSQTPQQRQNISNAIWLCATCSVLIDKNGGHDYPADHLRKWKKDHESLIKECLEGSKRVTFQFLTLSDQTVTCRKIIKFLDNKGALFVELDYEIPHYVFDSVKEIRTFLVGIHAEILEGSPLEVIVDSMNNACRHFMNTTNPTMTITEMTYGLGAMRKIIGFNLADMKRVYGVNLTSNLENLLPTD